MGVSAEESQPTPRAPQRPARVTYVGHATALIELDGVRLLTDPVLRPRILHIVRHAAPPAPEISEDIDAVLLSHLHHDHLDVASLRQLGKDVRVLVGKGERGRFAGGAFARVEELAPGEATRVGEVEVVATEADHEGRRFKFGPAVEALGYDVRGSHRVYFAGDTDLHPGMSELAAMAGGAAAGGQIDVALLPIGGWGTKIGPGHLDGDRAARAAAMIQPRAVIPIHWGTLAQHGLSDTLRERILRDPPRRLEAALARLAPGVEAAILEPGESYEL